MPFRIDSFNKIDDGYLIEYDGWNFEDKKYKSKQSTKY